MFTIVVLTNERTTSYGASIPVGGLRPVHEEILSSSTHFQHFAAEQDADVFLAKVQACGANHVPLNGAKIKVIHSAFKL